MSGISALCKSPRELASTVGGHSRKTIPVSQERSPHQAPDLAEFDLGLGLLIPETHFYGL